MTPDTSPVPVELPLGHSTSFESETKIGMQAAAALVPPYRGSRPTCPSTMFRWVKVGCRLPGGGRLRLQAQRIGGRWVTSKEALERFSAALTAAHAPALADAGVPLPVVRPSAAKTSARRAMRELERLGA